MDKLISKAAVHFFLIFIILGKAPKGLSFILQLKGNIKTLKKTMDLVQNKVVKYNGVFKSNGFNKAM